MIFSEKISYSEKVKDNKDFQIIINNIKEHEPVFGIFLIVMNAKGDYLFNIMSSYEMFKKNYNVNDYIVVGMARQREDAFLLLKDIIETYYNENENLDNIREYLSEGEK